LVEEGAKARLEAADPEARHIAHTDAEQALRSAPDPNKTRERVLKIRAIANRRSTA